MRQGGCGSNLCGRERGGELGAPFSFRDCESQRGEMGGQVRRWNGWLGRGMRVMGYLVGTVFGPWERGFECVGCGDRW